MIKGSIYTKKFSYSLSLEGKKLTFYTNSKEFKKGVELYINICLKSYKWEAKQADKNFPYSFIEDKEGVITVDSDKTELVHDIYKFIIRYINAYKWQEMNEKENEEGEVI